MSELKYLGPWEVKEVAPDGSFTGIASVYGVRDLGDDVIDKGAFSKTITEMPVVPVLAHHRSERVIGEGKVREWQGKIYIDGQLDLDDSDAVKMLGKMRKGLIKGLSIGFETVKSVFAEVEGRTIRHIQELKLWEVSLVTFPMLPQAQVVRVKSDDGVDRRFAELEAQILSLRADSKSSTPGEVTTPDPVMPDAGKGAVSTGNTPETRTADAAKAAEVVALLKKGVRHG